MDQSPKPSTSYAEAVRGVELNSNNETPRSTSWLMAYQREDEEEATAIALAESLSSVKTCRDLGKPSQPG
ncbi:hypothetical protein ACROYT_G038334 [Oculina patagonica]